MVTTTLLYAGLLPVVVAAVILLIAQQFGAAPRAAWAWSVALGFIAAQIGLKNHSGVVAAIASFAQPAEAADWLPIIVLTALAVSLMLQATPPAYRRLALALAVVFLVSVPVRLLGDNFRLTHEWSVVEKLAGLALMGAAIGSVWLSIAAEAEEQSTFGRILFVIIVAVGEAVVVTLSGVFIYGQSCGAVAAALGGASIASLLGVIGSEREPAGSARAGSPFRGFTGAAGVISCALGGLILLGHFFGELTLTNTALLFVSLAAAGAPLPKVVVGPWWQQLSIRAVLCLLPLTIAILSVVD